MFRAPTVKPSAERKKQQRLSVGKIACTRFACVRETVEVGAFMRHEFVCKVLNIWWSLQQLWTGEIWVQCTVSKPPLIFYMDAGIPMLSWISSQMLYMDYR